MVSSKTLVLHALISSFLLATAPTAAAAAATTTTTTMTIAPVIGVMAQPSSFNISQCGGKCEYIAASYVQWVESAGGRVLPIPYNASSEVLDTIVNSVNGLLVPGGSSLLSEGARYLFRRARQLNEEGGDFLPVWATCMGMEWMLQTFAQDDDDDESFVLDHNFDSWNLSLPLGFTGEASDSRLFRSLPPDLFLAASQENLTMNNHHKGITPTHLSATPALSDFFRVLSTNKDRQGLSFVSTVEGKELPFYGVQWHPEKAVFEWGMESNEEGEASWPYEAINHSLEAQELTMYLAQFFLAEARKNAHVFPEARQEALIYSYTAEYTGPEFLQKYFFTSYYFPPPAAATVEGEERRSPGLRGSMSFESSRRRRRKT